MPLRSPWLAIALGAALCAGAPGCKLQLNGTASGDDGGNGVNDGGDGGGQDSPPEAAPCSGLLCNGQCMEATDCTGCQGAPLLCASQETCTSDCTACQDTQGKAMPIECFACDQNHANPQGTCQYDDQAQYCLSGNYGAAGGPTGGFRCICGDAGVSACPGDTQVCVATPGGTNLCITCGEVYLDDVSGQSCKNGKTCSAASHACQ